MQKASFYRKPTDIDNIRDITEEEMLKMLSNVLKESVEKIKADMKSSKDKLRQTSLRYMVKSGKVKPRNFQIAKRIELTEIAYDNFARDLLKDRKFIEENKHLTDYDSSTGTYTCLMFYNPKREYAILVETQGANYARYAAKILLTEVAE